MKMEELYKTAAILQNRYVLVHDEAEGFLQILSFRSEINVTI
jgi:hypothetical protein